MRDLKDTHTIPTGEEDLISIYILIIYNIQYDKI